jgi:hypothetical protein
VSTDVYEIYCWSVVVPRQNFKLSLKKMTFRDHSLSQFFNPRRVPFYALPLYFTVTGACSAATLFLLYSAGKPECEWHRDKIKHGEYTNLYIRQDQTMKLYNPRKTFKDRVNLFFPKKLEP